MESSGIKENGNPRNTEFMELTGIKENGNPRKTEFMELTGTDFDSWIERLPLEDITNYFNYLVAVNEGSNVAAVGVGNNIVVDSSKENSGGEESIGEKVVMMSKSGEKIDHNQLKDKKLLQGNDLRKGFR